jgi:NADPH-ferrihemoprotein reductase
VFVRASSFRLPQLLSSPVLMIGPGTGIAPMRALLQERRFQSELQKVSDSTNVLYFGCKYRNVDYIYQEELESFKTSGLLNELHVAFSREGRDKVYVQHLLTRDASVVDLIDKGAYIFVCGGTSMGNDVHRALLQLLETHRKLCTSDATVAIEQLQKSGRYVQELWSA